MIFHERVITGLMPGGLQASALPPGFDHYIEGITAASPNIHTVHILTVQGEIPAGVLAAQC